MNVIYIASPYTIGDSADNVRTQIEAAHYILDMGHAPIAPLLAHFMHIHRPRPYQEWISMCLALVQKADILLRLPGESEGADKEVTEAERLGVHVAVGWHELERLLNASAGKAVQ